MLHPFSSRFQLRVCGSAPPSADGLGFPSLGATGRGHSSPYEACHPCWNTWPEAASFLLISPSAPSGAGSRRCFPGSQLAVHGSSAA